MKQIFPISSNISRSKTPFIINNGHSTFNKNTPQLNSTSSLFSSIDSNKGTNLTSYYKEFFLNQVNIKLDERVYDLISKMDDAKQYNEAKEQYDEAKRLLIREALNDKFNGYLKNNKNFNRLNLNNYVDRINEKYSFDEKVNQLMFSLFTKLKTRKKKVFKYKIKNHLEKLFQGNVALYKKRKENHFEEKKKPEKKFDMKLLIKSNSDLAEYIRKNAKKKVNFEEKENEKENTNKNNDKDENNKIQFKRTEKKKRTFLDKKTKIKEYFNNLNVISNRRKSFAGETNGFNNSNFNSLNFQKENDKTNNEDSYLLNLPNINDKIKFNNSKYNNSLKKELKENKSSNKLKKLNDNIILNFKDNQNQNEINPIAIEDEKIAKDNSDKKSSFSILKNQKNEEEIKKKNSIKNLIEKDIKINQNLYHKLDLNTKKQITRNRNNDNKSQKNIYISETAYEILSQLEKKEKKLTKSTSKLKKSLLYFKNTNENFKTIKENKNSNLKFNNSIKPNKNNRISTINNNINQNKKITLMFKQVNENNSQFHFPIINKLFYKDKKGKVDMIDRIKNNLKNEYSEKIKGKNINNIDKEIIGKEILNKLNDQYELEKLLEMANDIREKRRKEANYEI